MNIESIRSMYDSGDTQNAEKELSVCSPHDVSRCAAEGEGEGEGEGEREGEGKGEREGEEEREEREREKC